MRTYTILKNKVDLDSPLSVQSKDTSFVVFDLETTGFDFWRDQIIEIGAVKQNLSGESLIGFKLLFH